LDRSKNQGHLLLKGKQDKMIVQSRHQSSTTAGSFDKDEESDEVGEPTTKLTKKQLAEQLRKTVDTVARKGAPRGQIQKVTSIGMFLEECVGLLDSAHPVTSFRNSGSDSKTPLRAFLILSSKENTKRWSRTHAPLSYTPADKIVMVQKR